MRTLLCHLTEIIWYVGILLRCLALYLFIRRRLASVYPALTSMFGIGAVSSGLMVWIGWTGTDDSYARAWNAGLLVYLCLHTGALLEVCALQSRHTRGLARQLSLALGGVLILVVLLIVMATADLIPAPLARALPLILIGRHFSIACFLLLALSTWMSHSLFLRMCPNLRRHAAILGLYFLDMSVSAILRLGPTPPVVSDFVSAAVPCVCYVLWMCKMIPEGERPPHSVDVTAGDLESHVQRLKTFRGLAEEIMSRE